MAKKKKLIVAVIVISLFAVMSLCGTAVAGQQAMDRSDFHGSEDNVIDRAAIIDEENSMLVGKEVEDTTPAYSNERYERNTRHSTRYEIK